MACKKFYIQDAKLSDVVSRVREVAQSYRRTGLKGDHVAAQTAQDLGISERRVASFVYGDITTVTAEEAALIDAGFIAFLDREVARLTDRAAQVTARRIALTSPVAEQIAPPKRGSRLHVVSHPER